MDVTGAENLAHGLLHRGLGQVAGQQRVLVRPNHGSLEPHGEDELHDYDAEEREDEHDGEQRKASLVLHDGITRMGMIRGG